MSNVNYTREEVIKSLDKWQLVRDCANGQDAVKSRGDKYLPRPNPEDDSEANIARYDAYLTRALFYGVTGHTVRNLIGDAFDIAPLLDAPDALTAFVDNVDGNGLSLDQQAQRTMREVLLTGRNGLLVDYPDVDGVATQAEINAGLIRPTILSIRAEDIINWRTEAAGGVSRLSLVVIAESHEYNDGYETKTEKRWRELTLDGGHYRVVVYRQAENSNEFEIAQGPYYPTDASGNRFNVIPFFFVGAANNDTEIDDSPLKSIADLNISHYRNSADYEESCFMVGQPTPVFTGLTERWVNEVMGGQVYLGSRSGVQLPEGGDAMLLQAASNQMPREAMQDKERQMISLGARLVEAKQVQRTATETSIDARAEHSALGTIAVNISAAYTDALKVCAQFLGVDGDVSYQLNTDYDLQSIGIQERQQLLSELQAGAITWSEYRARLRGAGIATEDDEAAAESVQSVL